VQVAGLARRVHDSSTLKEKFDTLVQNDHDLTGDKTTLDRRVPTRWNADLTCLDAHIHFRNPVEQLTGAAINKLKAYRLSEPQWDMATTLSAILEAIAASHHNYLINSFILFQVFEEPTKLFSKAQVPLITEVLPILDAIEKSMTRVCNDPEGELPNVVRVAAKAALLMIKKYFSLMSKCDLYIIAIGMSFCLYLFKL